MELSEVDSVAADGDGTYLLLVTGGLEGVASCLVREQLAADGFAVRSLRCASPPIACSSSGALRPPSRPGAPVPGVLLGHAGCGKLALTTDAPPSVVVALRGVMSALALVAERDDVPNSRDALAAWATRAGDGAVRSGAWARALRLWARHNRGEAGGEAGARAVRGVRCSAVRDGFAHEFKSCELAAELGGPAMAALGAGWRVALRGFDLELVAIVAHHTAVLGLTLAPASDCGYRHAFNTGHLPAESRTQSHLPVDAADAEPPAGPARETHVTLRPSTAQLMLRCAAPCGSARVTDRERAPRVLVDPFAGSGVIPLEAAATADGGAPSAAPFALALGGEIDEPAVASTAQRSDAAPETPVPRAESALWDAARLPLRTACVDALVSDLPFGHRCGSAKENAKLYPRALREAARVIAVGGVAVLLATQRRLVDACVREGPWAPLGWPDGAAGTHLMDESDGSDDDDDAPARRARRRVNVGGLWVYLYALRRVEGALPPPKLAEGTIVTGKAAKRARRKRQLAALAATAGVSSEVAASTPAAEEPAA